MGSEKEVSVNVVELCGEYTEKWAILANKGYQDGSEFSTVVNPKRKPFNQDISRTDELRKSKLHWIGLLNKLVSGNCLDSGT